MSLKVFYCVPVRRKMEPVPFVAVLLCIFSVARGNGNGVGKSLNAQILFITLLLEEDWGDGLKVWTTYKPKECEFRAQVDDVIHYHYVGRLGHNGKVFGRRYLKLYTIYDQ